MPSTFNVECQERIACYEPLLIRLYFYACGGQGWIGWQSGGGREHVLVQSEKETPVSCSLRLQIPDVPDSTTQWPKWRTEFGKPLIWDTQKQEDKYDHNLLHLWRFISPSAAGACVLFPSYCLLSSVIEQTCKPFQLTRTAVWCKCCTLGWQITHSSSSRVNKWFCGSFARLITSIGGSVTSSRYLFFTSLKICWLHSAGAKTECPESSINITQHQFDLEPHEAKV